ncbi:Hpt domain-containing protein [Pedobacter sp. HMF7647]|uniref:Hpt domain-containing protein n=1 Tax=Hufsiella arboris TaxID=2695275 RepID=A0A7K1YD70_9SPHI|nr:Hpt domain-containing protein [Hufsiella arboris]MXV52536.1 Hpt domain-containing protein [Hufsiella arboris]
MTDSRNEKLNLSYLNEIADGSTEFVIEMIDIFLEQTPGYFNILNEAVAGQDWKTTMEVAHKIKPTLAFIGLNEARDEIQEVEQNTRDLVDLDQIKSKVDKVNSLCADLFIQLKAYKKELEIKLRSS